MSLCTGQEFLFPEIAPSSKSDSEFYLETTLFLSSLFGIGFLNGFSDSHFLSLQSVVRNLKCGS